MFLLDTDHVTVLKMPMSIRRSRLETRMANATDVVGIPIIAVEETMRGWLASLAKERQSHRQVLAYRELGGLFQFFAGFPIAEFDSVCADQDVRLIDMKLRMSMRDRKIAATTLAIDAVFLTANRRDFEKVPGLKFENWLD